MLSNLCCSSLSAAVESDQFLSSWGRFLYDVVSLCEREAATLLTVVNSWIFSLNSTDGQREVRAASTATEPIWCFWFRCAHKTYQELWSLSSFLLVPVHRLVSIIKCANRFAGFTGECDSGSWSWCHYWRLSHSHLTTASCRKTQTIHLSSERNERKGKTSCLKCCRVNEPVKQQQASVQMRMVMRVMLVVVSAELTDWSESCSVELTGL